MPFGRTVNRNAGLLCLKSRKWLAISGVRDGHRSQIAKIAAISVRKEEKRLLVLARGGVP